MMTVPAPPGAAAVDPLKLTAEQLAFLKDALPETPCVGPDGAAAGYWVEAEQFRALRRMAYIELERARENPPELPPVDPARRAALDAALEGMDYGGSPGDVVFRMIDRWTAAGLLEKPAASSDESAASPDGSGGDADESDRPRRKAA